MSKVWTPSVMAAANDRYGSSLDRTLGASKPVDPATRLSELLAQSLEELTRPFDPPRPAGAVQPVRAVAAEGSPADQPAGEPAPEPSPEESRLDADKALAELEAELFAAAKQVNNDAPPEAHAPADHPAEPPGDDEPPTPAELADVRDALDAVKADAASNEPNESDIVPPPLVPASSETTPEPDADAAGVIAKVRRLMLVSMAITVIAVGSVFGFIGYRMFKGDGVSAKTADKIAPSSPIPTDVTLSLPRGARVVQSAVSADRLIMTLEIDGKIEVRTFDVKTLQPAARLNFSATP